MSPPTLHSRLGASGAKRWMACPGSVRLSEGIEDTGSIFAWEGTAAHELGEMCLTENASPFDYVGEVFTVDVDENTTTDIEVTHEMAEAVEVFVDHVRSRQAARPNATLQLEQRCSLEKLNPPEPMFGTADVSLHEPDLLEVIDYKHGRGVVVEVHENPQLMYYALLAAVATGRIPDRIRVTIVQPRAFHPVGPVRSYEFDKERLIGFKHQLFEAAEKTQDPAAPLQVGDHCKFCKAKPTCPAQRDHAVDLLESEFEYEAMTPPSPEALTPDELGVILQRSGLVMDWIREVESHALAFMENGGTIPGYKLVAKRSNRKWIDKDAAENYLRRRGLKTEERTKRTLISPAQAEATLKRLGMDTKKLDKHWEKPEGAPKMVPADDPRPEVTPAVEQDFEFEEAPKQLTASTEETA